MPIRVYYEVLNQKGTPALYSDNYAQRPAAGYQGRIFYSPDTAQIFYDTGSTWTLLADAGVGSGSLASVCANGNTTATGIAITAGGLSTNSLTSTNLTAGSIPFIGTGGLFSQDNTNFFWDNTNKYLGINTNTPSVAFDIHSTNNVQIQLNNTSTFDSKIAFLNAGVGKWRIGNLYSGGTNLFHIYNNAGATLAMQINSSNAALFYGSLSSNSFIQAASGITLTNGGTTTTAGATNIGGLTAGLSIALASGFNQTLTFPTGVAYTYTFPSATGTLINGTSFTSGVLPKYSSTSGVLTNSMLSDDGTTLSSVGATRSNLYLRAVNNSYYGQLAFTNGSNGSFGGISYNNSGQYMQFETNSSEWMRLLSDGKLGLNTTNPLGQFEVALPAFTNEDTSSQMAIFGSGSSGRGVRIGYNQSNSIGYIYALNPNVAWQDLKIAANNIFFASGGSSERGKFTSAGYFKVSTNGAYLNTGAYHELTTNGNNYSTAIGNISSIPYGLLIYYSTVAPDVTGDNQFLSCSDTSNNKLTIWSSGTVVNRTGVYGTISDTTLKENIIEATPKLEDLLKLKVRNFNFIGENTKQLGFIAQEFEDVFPNMVYIDKNNNKHIKTSILTPMLVKGIQELNTKVTNLEEAVLTLQQNLN
jgi:hypothetical protein